MWLGPVAVLEAWRRGSELFLATNSLAQLTSRFAPTEQPWDSSVKRSITTHTVVVAHGIVKPDSRDQVRHAFLRPPKHARRLATALRPFQDSRDHTEYVRRIAGVSPLHTPSYAHLAAPSDRLSVTSILGNSAPSTRTCSSAGHTTSPTNSSTRTMASPRRSCASYPPPNSMLKLWAKTMRPLPRQAMRMPRALPVSTLSGKMGRS